MVLSLSAASAAEKSPAKGEKAAPTAKLADAHVISAWTRAARAGEDTHVFLTVENKGAAPIFLKGGAAEVASSVQLVRFQMLGAYLRTTLVDPVAVDPHGRFVFEPGVVALELRNLRTDLRRGETLPLRVVFADLGEIPVTAEVDGRTAIRYDDPPADLPEAKSGAH